MHQKTSTGNDRARGRLEEQLVSSYPKRLLRRTYTWNLLIDNTIVVKRLAIGPHDLFRFPMPKWININIYTVAKICSGCGLLDEKGYLDISTS